MQRHQIPEISIVVPVLNEAAMLPFLFATLAIQQGIHFELIICDGGSNDGTQDRVAELAPRYPFEVSMLQAPRGRGCQMNRGAARAVADTLLFLHVDSAFDSNDALAKALAALQASGPGGVAGRFALRFRRKDTTPSLAYFFYESKARLDRPDCIRGDQGFMIPRESFHELGPFDESLPYLEDIHFVDSVASKGTWVLFPSVITTSARRFEREGLLERQIVNAIIVNCARANWTEFFFALPSLYQIDADSGKLQLLPILNGIRFLLADRSRAWRKDFWRRTGRHVAGNAWQLFFWLDVRRTFSVRKGAGEVQPHFLNFYRRRLGRLFESFLAAALAAALVWLWFRMTLFRLRGTMQAEDKNPRETSQAG